jgi:hypothetical protein
LSDLVIGFGVTTPVIDFYKGILWWDAFFLKSAKRMNWVQKKRVEKKY